MIVRIQILKNNVVEYSWAIFIVDEFKCLQDIFSSIQSGTLNISLLFFYVFYVLKVRCDPLPPPLIPIICEESYAK